MNDKVRAPKLIDLFKVFLKLGTIGFGGPAAHVALMREEVVVKRSWLSEKEFFDLVGATNLIPGPNSTELAIHIGHRFGKTKGLLIAGTSFIFPAFLIVLLFAIFYGTYGSLPEVNSVLMAIRPVIVAVILFALIGFRKSAVHSFSTVLTTILSFLAAWGGYNEVLIVLAGGFLNYFFNLRGFKRTHSIELYSIFYIFLKIGSVLFGSGYVLLAFLKSEFVDQRMWLTGQELIDAVSVGQFTPGPVFTTATFVGYILSGFKGAVLATVGIFLPSFFFVAVSAPFLSRLRNSHFFSILLDGINASSFALMFYVTIQLALESVFDFSTGMICVLSLLGIHFLKLNSTLLILIAGLIGYFLF